MSSQNRYIIGNHTLPFVPAAYEEVLIFLVYRIGESLDLLVHENLNFHIDAWTTSSLDVLLSNSAQGCNGKLSKSVENIK